MSDIRLGSDVFGGFRLWLERQRRSTAAAGIVQEADGWLADNRSVLVAWAKPNDIRAVLFMAAGAVQRDALRDALGVFFDYLIESEWIDVNPACEFGYVSTMPRPRGSGVPPIAGGA